MNYENIRYERRGAAAWIRLNRPAQLNALSSETLDECEAALSIAEKDAEVRAVVFAAAGRAFCAGADLKALNDLPPEAREAATAAFIAKISAMMDRIEVFPKPTIAAVNGIAMAGGLELVLACDLVVASEEAKLGDGHAKYGLLPGAGGSVRLPRKISPNRANYLFFTGDLLPAQELADWGLVNRVVSAGTLESTVEEWVTGIATKSPLGLARMKVMARAALDSSASDALRQEQILAALHLHSYDRNEGVAAFNEKRAPRYLGR